MQRQGYLLTKLLNPPDDHVVSYGNRKSTRRKGKSKPSIIQMATMCFIPGALLITSTNSSPIYAFHGEDECYPRSESKGTGPFDLRRDIAGEMDMVSSFVSSTGSLSSVTTRTRVNHCRPRKNQRAHGQHNRQVRARHNAKGQHTVFPSLCISL